MFIVIRDSPLRAARCPFGLWVYPSPLCFFHYSNRRFQLPSGSTDAIRRSALALASSLFLDFLFRARYAPFVQRVWATLCHWRWSDE
jgi:hypothetical protein